jgi:biopolymer transport protein ExbB/TolQ
MNQLTLIIFGVLLLVIAGGTAYHFYEVSENSKQIQQLNNDNNQLKLNNKTLDDNNKSLTDAVNQNEATIKAQQDKTQQLLDSQQQLSNSLSSAEAESYERTAKIKDGPSIQSSIDNPDEVEKQINDDYTDLTNQLISITSDSGSK